MPVINWPFIRYLGDGCVLVILGLAIVCGPTRANEQISEKPAWAPEISETLVRLNARYLSRSIDNDLSRAGFARALRVQSDRVAARLQAIAELQSAVRKAGGTVPSELRYQLLIQKRTLVRLLGERVSLRRQEWKIRNRFYQAALRAIDKKGNSTGYAAEELPEMQEGISLPMSIASSDIDGENSKSTSERSRQAAKYAAIELAKRQLIAEINSHPISRYLSFGDDAVYRRDYLEKLSRESDAMLVKLNEEEQMLGFMAKLVALDAMALSVNLSLPKIPKTVTSGMDLRSVPGHANLFLK